MVGWVRGRGRPQARVCLGAAALAVLVAGCTPSGGSEEDTTPEPEEAVATAEPPASTGGPTPVDAREPSGGDIPVPTVWVLSAPPGFQDVMPEALTGEWADIVTSSECVLAGRAGAQTDAVDDMRAASLQRLQQIAAQDGASLDEVADLDLTSQGAGEGNDPNYVITFAAADWAAGGETVRGLSRVGNLVQYDGSLVSQWLDLTFTCAGEIDEQAWTAVTDDLRPVMQFTDPGGWDGLNPESF